MTDQATGICYRSSPCHSSGVVRQTVPVAHDLSSLDVLRYGHARVQGGLHRYHGALGRVRPEQRFTQWTYRFNNGVPNQLTMRAHPDGRARRSLKAELGIYAQDRWTMDKATINAGLRYDYHSGYWSRVVPRARAVRADAGHHVPGQGRAGVGGLSPRLGLAYDLFGNGRTAHQGERGPLRRWRSAATYRRQPQRRQWPTASPGRGPTATATSSPTATC